MVLRTLADLLVPSRCPSCGVPTTSVWCGRCLVELQALTLPNLAATELDDGVMAVGAYAYGGVVRDSVVAAKVRGHHEALEAMGAMLSVRLALPPDVVRTWVPTARRALRRRGVCVPRALAGESAVPLLRCVREETDQTELSASARRRAKRHAFAAIGAVPERVVLIDDVRTTGATARAAAGALRAAGAQRVLVATFAVAGDEARAAVHHPPET